MSINELPYQRKYSHYQCLFLGLIGLTKKLNTHPQRVIQRWIEKESEDIRKK